MKIQSGGCNQLPRFFSVVFAVFILAAFAVTANAGKLPPPTCSIDVPVDPIVVGQPVTFTGNVNDGQPPYRVGWKFKNANPKKGVTKDAGSIDIKETTFKKTGQQTVVLTAQYQHSKKCMTSVDVTVMDATSSSAPPVAGGEVSTPLADGGGTPTSRGDAYATPVGKTLTIQVSRVSGVLYNDFDTDPVSGDNIGNAGLTAQLVNGPSQAASFNLNADGSFTYTPNASLSDNDNDSFTYQAMDADGNLSDVAIVNIHIASDQPDFKIMMNYELGMHCTGFEFSYCCVLPPYNSIVAQVVKPQSAASPFPRLLTADPVNGLDGLGRETVLRDYDADGTFHKYYLEYRHDAMPRLEGNMPGSFNSTAGKDTLISAVEGNSLLYTNTPYDSAQVDTDGSITGVPGKLVTGTYAGLDHVVLGDGDYTDNTDNYANGWLNHFYIYADLEGSNPADTSLEADKIRLGVAGMVEYPKDTGAALQPMGPTGNGLFDNVLTFSGDTGTVVYTQMKVLENLPIMLTAPRIWEALGLPTTAFEDSIDFFADPGKIDEDTIRPFVAMKAQLIEANCDEATGACTKGDAVIGSDGKPVIGFGTSPIDIPNCERCHSAPAYQADGVSPNVNSPNYTRRQNGYKPFYGPAGETLEAMVDLEINYWKAYYDLDESMGDTEWYARLKGAAISIEVMHDYDMGTNFTANYPVADGENPLGLPPEKAAIVQNTRMGHEAVICQKCHADNVIAVVKSAGIGGYLVPPISEAIHNAHAAKSAGGPITFDDSLGRFGGCQGCHPAHRSDGVMDNYPVSRHGDNTNADGDNRLGAGGCFVGRDVHSNPLKDMDGAETPSHLNTVGQWLLDNVANDTGQWRGIWCTNCHTQLSQELWRTEDCNDLIHGDCKVNPRAAGPDISDVAAAVGLTTEQAIDYLDPKNPAIDPGRTSNQTHAAWDATIPDANVATIELGADGNPQGTTDEDGDFTVNILSFCTTTDCVDLINANKGDQSQWRYPESGAVDGVSGFISTASTAVPVPFSVADDARDHWLSAGEPHCADCHAAPYVEQSGNITAFPPFNYPAKASLMRYTRGHQDLSCQACHESIHGLYPVGAAIDTTTYAQAAALNADGSHGPLKCGACHEVDSDGIPTWIAPFGDGAVGGQISSFDDAVGWAHTYTAEANVLNTTCQNCHGVNGDFFSDPDTNSTPADWGAVASHEPEFLMHADGEFTSRQMMDKAEILVSGSVYGSTDGSDGVCLGCHEDNSADVACNSEWREHLTRGRVAESVWEQVSTSRTGGTCGW